MHNRAVIAAIAPRSRSSRRDRGAIADKFLQGLVACSRLSGSGEDAKVKGTQKVDGAKKKTKGERACNHFFYDPSSAHFWHLCDN